MTSLIDLILILGNVVVQGSDVGDSEPIVIQDTDVGAPKPESKPLLEVVRPQHVVAKIKGMEPERFIVIVVDWGAGQIKSITKDMSEKEMKEHLQNAGVSERMISMGIANARANPI